MKRTVIPVLLLLCACSASYAEVIDSMEQTTGWTTQADSKGSTVTIKTDGGYTGNSMRMDYNFGGGEWSQVLKDFSTMDFSAGDTLKFWFKGSGSQNNLQIQLVDSDGTDFVETIPGVSNTAKWTELTLSFKGVSPDISYGWQHANYPVKVDELLASTGIVKMAFGVNAGAGGKGTLAIDNVRLYKTDPGYKILTNFDGLNGKNRFGGDSGTFTGNTSIGSPEGVCTAMYVTTTVYAGTGALQLAYDVSTLNSFAGYWTYLSSADISNTNYISFMVRSDLGGERFRVQLRGIDNKESISNYVTVTTSWQEVKIPFSAFAHVVTTGPASSLPVDDQLAFVFENNIAGAANGPTAGTVYIDDIKFTADGAGQTLVRTIDTMDEQPSSIGRWTPYGQQSGPLQSTKGATVNDTDRAIELNYDLSGVTADKQWAVIECNAGLNITEGTAFRFNYKGTGANSNIEFKATDMNDTTFWRKYQKMSNTNGAWQALEIPFKEMSLFTGSTQYLDLTKIKTILIAVSKKDGTAGTLWIDNLEFVTPQSHQFTTGSVLESLQVPFNPISPNGDGLKDKAQFVLRLRDSALVKLEIFTLKGENVFSKEVEFTQDNNDYVIEWDATDKDHSLVSNGLYLYRVTAKGSTGQEDKITNLIGVIR